MICPYCKKNQSAGKPIWPFCSARCKQLDLGAWAKEEYRVAGKEAHVSIDEEGELNNDLDDELMEQE